jgi:hypothetical protein
MSSTDTYVDGGGVLKDQPLTAGSVIRFVIDPEDRERDITVHVVPGAGVMVKGMWNPIITHPMQSTQVMVTTLQHTGYQGQSRVMSYPQDGAS